MIAFLQGKPVAFGSDLTVLVNGVGYDVHVGAHTATLCLGKEQVELHIHTFVREDRLELYGFQTSEAKQLFLQLLDVSGVGPSTALAITEQGPAALVEAVQQADVGFFTAIPRVGKKLAQKIIIELKSKLGSLVELDLGPLNQNQSDVTEALLSLGFDERRVLSVVRELDLETMSVEEAVKRAVQNLGKN